MTEQHKHVDAEAEKLTDGDFVAEVAHPAPGTDGAAGSADGSGDDADEVSVPDPQE